LAGGRKYLVLGPGKNGGYHRAGRVGVSTGGRLRWGRINISAVQIWRADVHFFVLIRTRVR
jgi:hypothetical protein